MIMLRVIDRFNILSAIISIGVLFTMETLADDSDRTPLRGMKGEVILNIGELDKLYVQDTQYYTLGISISPEKGCFVSIGCAGIVVWDYESGYMIEQLMDRTEMNVRLGKIAAVLFSPDGKWFVASGEKNTILWKCTNWTVVWERNDLSMRATLNFSPDGYFLFLGKPPTGVSLSTYQREEYLCFHDRGDLVEAETGDTKYSVDASYIPWHPFSANGRYFCSVDANLIKVYIYHVNKQKQTSISVNPGYDSVRLFNFMAYLDNGESLLTRTIGDNRFVDYSRHFEIWNTATGNLSRSIDLDWETDPEYGDTMKDVQPIFADSIDNASYLLSCSVGIGRYFTKAFFPFYSWNIETGICNGIYYIPNFLTSDIIPVCEDFNNGSHLLFHGHSTDLFVANRYDLSPEFNVQTAINSCIHPDRQSVLFARYNSLNRSPEKIDVVLSKWDIANTEDSAKTHNFFAMNSESPFVFSNSGEVFFYEYCQWSSKDWNFLNGFKVDYMCGTISTPMVSPRYSPNDRLFLGAFGNSICVWNTALPNYTENEQIACVTGSNFDNRFSLNFSHSGEYFLAATGKQNVSGLDNLIQIWECDEYKLVQSLVDHSDSVWCAEFSPDDRQIVSASLDGTAKVWDAASGLIVCEFVGHATGVEYAAFMPDGGWVMSVGRDRRAFLWDAETAEVERTFENIHLSAQLSPDGKYLFAGSEVWDIETGERIKTLDGVAQDYSCLALSPDGTLLLTSEYEGFTKVWNVQEHILKPSGIWDSNLYE